MSHRTHRLQHNLAALLLVLAAGLGSTAWAAAKPVADAPEAQYQKERALCLSGQSNQDRATCLQEAAAARTEARRGGLDDGGLRLRHNARERCNGLPTDERSACVARMKGQGTTSGSAAAGGILRELVVPEQPAASASR